MMCTAPRCNRCLAYRRTQNRTIARRPTAQNIYIYMIIRDYDVYSHATVADAPPPPISVCLEGYAVT